MLSREDAVYHDDVEVDVEVEAAAETLDEGDGGELGFFERDGASPHAVTLSERAGECADDLRQEVRVVRSAGADVERKREHPLADGNRRDDAIDDVGRRVAHSTAGAARAEAARLARERDEDVVIARITSCASEAVIEDAATQVATELVADVLGERRVVASRVRAR